MMDEILGMMIGFGVPATVILLPLYWRAVERRQLLGIMRAATERGDSVPVELFEAMSKGFVARPPGRTVDLRRGLFLLAIALGLALIGFGVYAGMATSLPPGERTDLSPVAVGIIVASIGAIPGCVGLAYVLLGLSNRLNDLK